MSAWGQGAASAPGLRREAQTAPGRARIPQTLAFVVYKCALGIITPLA